MCKAFFSGCKVKILPHYDINQIPKMETRQVAEDEGQMGAIQYNASKICSFVNMKYKPENKRAICFIAVTMKDIYPEDEFNFVFGLANILT
mmetsp:Transcript_35871/g.34926  ORF Transcript_35871/g.34926 Transcript_35871/m.34926 type:complete len:91 (+) Transcript_35871:305-577(+)